MKKVIVYGCGILLAVVLTGCGKASADALVKDLLAAEDDNVTFGENVRAGKIDLNKMEKIGQRLADLKAQLAAMPKDEVDAAKEKYKDEFAKLAERKNKLDSRLPKLKPGMAK